MTQNKEAELHALLVKIANEEDKPFLSKEESGMEFARKDLARDLLEDFFKKPGMK